MLHIPRDLQKYGLCHGDSGGPLFVEGPEKAPHQFGVGSRSDKLCGGEASPAPIASNYDWIRETMIKLGASDPVPPRGDDPGNCIRRSVEEKSQDGRPYLQVNMVNQCSTSVDCIYGGWYDIPQRAKTTFRDMFALAVGANRTSEWFGVISPVNERDYLVCSTAQNAAMR
jgi:hypothetical protein